MALARVKLAGRPDQERVLLRSWCVGNGSRVALAMRRHCGIHRCNICFRRSRHIGMLRGHIFCSRWSAWNPSCSSAKSSVCRIAMMKLPYDAGIEGEFAADGCGQSDWLPALQRKALRGEYLFAGSRRSVDPPPAIFFFAAGAVALKIGIEKRDDVTALITHEPTWLAQHGTERFFGHAVRATGFGNHRVVDSTTISALRLLGCGLRGHRARTSRTAHEHALACLEFSAFPRKPKRRRAEFAVRNHVFTGRLLLSQIRHERDWQASQHDAIDIHAVSFTQRQSERKRQEAPRRRKGLGTGK